ncbi:MAG: hypothetical protein GEV09_18585 [Pseudonocardiaceae bacterium]|nr:hypothetical protein [Pseudonocardiaceae bacterium]
MPGDVTTNINKDCGVAVVSINNTTDYTFAADWTASAASTAGETSGTLVADGRDGGNPSSASQTIRFPEDIGEVTVDLVVEKGAERDDYPAPKSAVVTTDCQEPEPTYPQDCEIEGGVDDGESGTQESAEADCVSNSPGYESDEVGGPCVLDTGEPGGGAGVVTEDGACEEPASDEPPADGDQDGGTDEGGEQKDEPKPDKPDADLDCADFPLADGTTAQNVLDADGSDPHRLDADNDGKACEGDAQEDTEPCPNAGTISDSGDWAWNCEQWIPVDTDDAAAPDGGVETGDGGTEKLAYTGAGNALGWLAGGLGLVGAGALTLAAGPRLLRRT